MRNVALDHLLTVAYRLACASMLIALALLSLLPADSIHRTELGGHGEHLLAYGGTALVFGIRARQRTWVALLTTLMVYAALLETLQRFTPGRTSQISDFLYSAAGLSLGFLVAVPLQARLR